VNLFTFIILVSLIVNTAIGVFVYMAQPQRRINQCFLLLVVVIAAWQAAMWKGALASLVPVSAFWIRQTSAISGLIPPAMNLFRLSILHSDASIGAMLRKSRLWVFFWAATALLCQTSFFLESARLPERDGMLAIPVYGPGFILFAVYFLASLATLFTFLIRDTLQATGVERSEMEYVLFSCGTSLFIGVFFLIVPNLTGWIDLGALLPVSVIVFTAITGYGIATRGILDVPVVARRIIAYTILSIYLVLVYVAVLFLATHFLKWLEVDPSVIAPFLAACAMVASVSPAHGTVQKLANRLFINAPPLDVGQTLREAGRALNNVMTTEELSRTFHDILQSSLETSRLHIFLREDDQFKQVYPPGEHRTLSIDSPLPTLLEGNSRMLVRELIERDKSIPFPQVVRKELDRLKASAVVGAHREHTLNAILLFGPRTSGRIYGREETAAAEGLRDLFSVAYDNAHLYTQLRNSRIYMDLLLKNLVNGVIACDTRERITTCNHEAARILRLDPAELQDRSIRSLPAPLHSLLDEAFHRDRILRDRELELDGLDEEPCHLSAGAALFRNHAGDIVGGLLVFQDRTALKQLEEQVRRAERLASLGTLSAGMAHEIKNPLVTLKTFAQLLPERYEDEEFRKTFSNLAEKEIGRIDALVNQLLSFARPVKPKLERISLHDTLQTNVKWFSQQAGAQGVRVLEDYRAREDRIHGDADQLQQVFLNLFLNAQEAMEAGGELRIATLDDPQGILLRISDTGSGISPDDLDHVFDPFFTTKSSGTGLGLAVAHQILKEHHVDVRVTSEPHKGSTFELKFPLNTEDDGP